MNVVPGGLAGAMGALKLDQPRAQVAARPAAVGKPAAATAPSPASRPDQPFEAGLFRARAVAQPQQAERATPPHNPNLPRGSVIDLKV